MRRVVQAVRRVHVGHDVQMGTVRIGNAWVVTANVVDAFDVHGITLLDLETWCRVILMKTIAHFNQVPLFIAGFAFHHAVRRIGRTDSFVVQIHGNVDAARVQVPHGKDHFCVRFDSERSAGDTVRVDIVALYPVIQLAIGGGVHPNPQRCDRNHVVGVGHCILQVVIGGDHFGARFCGALADATVATVATTRERTILGHGAFGTFARCVIAFVAVFGGRSGLL